jgi:hypothetical protein
LPQTILSHGRARRKRDALATPRGIDIAAKFTLSDADFYVEAQLLRQAALKETGRACFVNGLAFDDQHHLSIDTQQQALLYQNAATFASTNNVSFGVALTDEQQNSLDRPLLWYVEQKIKHKGESGKGEEIAAIPQRASITR